MAGSEMNMQEIREALLQELVRARAMREVMETTNVPYPAVAGASQNVTLVLLGLAVLEVVGSVNDVAGQLP